MLRYLIVIEPTPDGGWGAWAPDMPGVVALGDSREECDTGMRTATKLYLRGLHEDGAAVPAPRSVVAEAEVSAV